MKTRLALCLYAGLLSTAAWAGCGEGSGQCYYYQAGALKSRGACQVTTCAATDQYFYTTWEWQKGGNNAAERGNLLIRRDVTPALTENRVEGIRQRQPVRSIRVAPRVSRP